MWQPGGGAQSSRLPPRWEPASNVSFRSWTQDLMLWTISSDLQPHQQCALIISQLGGAARDVARTLTPNEVYAGGFVNGQQVDPITYLLHGLSQRFAPLDDELRLRATQDLLGFSRRGNETVDALISRFEIVRQRARIEGGGAVSIETASLMLLKAVGVSPEQFQSLTQPFGLRLPNTEDEFLQLTHHLRRMGHIVERSQLNIASTLNRTSQHHWTNEQQAYQAEENPPTSAFMPEDQPSGWGDGPSDWAYATGVAEEEASWTDSATSSDQEGYLVDTQDLRGMTNQQADEYLFGRYQDAKRRWRRFTGKPVRHLRKVFRRKGKGKGKGKGSRSFLNLSETLEQSAYFKGKGKGGRSSGKGFGRRMNPKGRDGEVLKCSICNSMYHLRARCPQQSAQQSSAAQSSSQPAGHIGAAARAPSMYADSGLHFVAGHTEHFMSTAQSEASWTNVNDPAVETPRSRVAEPEVHPMTPTVDHVFEQDPWMQWHQRQQSEAQVPELPLPRPGATIAPSFSMPAPSVNIASPCMFMPMPAAQAATTAAVRRPNWDWPGLSFRPPQAMPAPAIEPSSAVKGLFTQVNMLRSSNPSLLNAPARPSAPPEDPPNTRLYQDTCTICQTVFAPLDHVCRTTCRHVYHSLCIGELIQHAGETSFECPNCRVPTEVDHSWQFPDLAAAQPQVTEELPLPSAGHSVAADDEAVRTPVPSEHGTDFEWQTPEGVESSFPWWPVPSHDEEAEQSAFLTSTVRMPNGSLGLLVDPGSYGNLCGEGWATEASEEAKKHGYSVDVSDRETPLNVGGIGRGSQVCKKDVVLPAVIGRSDGSYQAGTFQAPVIEGSSAPALLGLKSLKEHRALLDVSSGMLHLCAPGEIQITLPPGSESLPLATAPTGHLLLPFQEYAKFNAASTTPGHLKHLFSEPAVSSASSSTTKVTIAAEPAPSMHVVTEEAPPEPAHRVPLSSESATSDEVGPPTSAAIPEPTYAVEEAEEIPDAILTSLREGTAITFRAKQPKPAPPKVKPALPGAKVSVVAKAAKTRPAAKEATASSARRAPATTTPEIREELDEMKQETAASRQASEDARRRAPVTPPKASDPKPAESTAAELTAVGRQPPKPPPPRRLRCPAGHPLETFVAPEAGYDCSKCKTRFGKGKEFKSCRLCDFDLCGACVPQPPLVLTPRSGEAKAEPIKLTPRSDEMTVDEPPVNSGASSSSRPMTAFAVVHGREPRPRSAASGPKEPSYPPPGKAKAKAKAKGGPKAKAMPKATVTPEEEDDLEEVEVEEETDPAGGGGGARRRRPRRRRRNRGGPYILNGHR